MSDHKKEVIPPPTLEGERESGTKRGGPEWVGRWEAVGWIKEKAAILPPLFVPDSLSPSRVGGGITSFLLSLIHI